MININQPSHKYPENLDFPCTISVQFFVRENKLCCDVFSRSEDIIFGLPYDMGFFSFLNELVYTQLNESGKYNLRLGHTSIKCSFTQIYDQSEKIAEQVLKLSKKKKPFKRQMPFIENAEMTLRDIYNREQNTAIMKWINENADLKN